MSHNVRDPRGVDDRRFDDQTDLREWLVAPLLTDASTGGALELLNDACQANGAAAAPAQLPT